MIVLFMHEINHSNDFLNVLIFLRKYLTVQRQYSTEIALPSLSSSLSLMSSFLGKTRLIFATRLSCLCLCNKEKRSETCEASKLPSPLRDESGGTAQKLRSDLLGRTAE